MDIIEYWPFGLVGLLVLAYLYKRDKDKKSDKTGGGKLQVVPISPPYGKGYMSVLAHPNGTIYAGSYNLHGDQIIWRNRGGNVKVPDARESVYDLIPEGNNVLVACEESNGRMFRLAGNALSPILTGAKNSPLSCMTHNGQILAVSTDFNHPGVRFHNVNTGYSKTLNVQSIHARKIFEFKGSLYIIGFDYASETGGFFVSHNNGVSWAWKPHMKGIRPLDAVEARGKMFFACSPYSNGSRHGPAQIWTWDGKQCKHHYSASNGHAMFKGITAFKDTVYAGTLTNWNGRGQAELYEYAGSSWRLIWRCPQPEIFDLSHNGEWLFVATRNVAGGGRVYRVRGRGNYDAPSPHVRNYRQLGAGFRWKVQSEMDHKLVILFPSHMAPGSVKVNNEPHRTDAGYPKRTNGDRMTFRFSKPGSAYGKNVIMEVDGTKYLIPDGGQELR